MVYMQVYKYSQLNIVSGRDGVIVCWGICFCDASKTHAFLLITPPCNEL